MKLEVRHLAEPVNVARLKRGKSSKPSRRIPQVKMRAMIFVGLLALDILGIVASFIFASIFRGASIEESGLLVMLALIIPIYIVTAINARAYDTINLQDPFRAVANAIQPFALTISAVILVAFGLKASGSYSRIVLTIGSIGSIFTLGTARYLFVRHMEAIIGGNPYRVILIADGEQDVPMGKFATVVSTDESFDPNHHDPAIYDRLAKILEGADRVVVACNAERRIAWAHVLKGANVQSEIFVPELGTLAPLGISMCGKSPTIIVGRGPLSVFDRLMKRTFDVAGATAGLTLLAPVFLIVAMLIKLDSPGAVLFKQVRIGRGNQTFSMLKFRSMRTESSDGAGERSTSREDARITRVGAFIRRTSLDELPQLINVLKGEMSIVGPRPHALGSRAADKLFWEVDRRYWHRHATRPGLTGLAQIRGFRGATLYESDLQNRLQADLEYLENWTIWRDLKIIVLTFRVLLHRNAF